MTTTEHFITNHLDVWSSVVTAKSSNGRGKNQKLELYGLKKLRELILDLAVRGLLVPQNPTDEPASMLLKKIGAEKARLVKEGKIKKPKKLPPISKDETPFDLPEGWEWVYFGEIAQHNAGKTLDRGRNTGELRDYLTTSNLYWGRFDLLAVRQMPIRQDELDKCSAQKGDLLICEGGEAGRAAVWNEDYEICFQNHVHRARFYSDIDPYYAYRYFEKLSATGEINKYRKGVGISNMSGKTLSSVIFALPPISEQHRIVAKVDELMALCDRLEQRQEANISTHRTLVDTLLAALTTAGGRGRFDEAWARIAAHFDSLFTTEESIDQLKQTILQLAVMGKLVPQNPDDEPASALLKSIAAEKATLVKAGKIKKQKKLPPISDEEKPFELPEGWGFKRLGDLSYVFSGNSFKSEDFNKSYGTRVIKITNAGVGTLIETKDFLPESFSNKFKNFRVIEGDLVLALTRPYISTGLKVSICPKSYHNSLLNQRVAAIRTFMENMFLYQYMQSVYVLGLYKTKFGGSGLQPNLKMRDVTDLVIPVPPIEEQPRIVAKVDALMALCDGLKERIRASQATRRQLADAIAAQASQ